MAFYNGLTVRPRLGRASLRGARSRSRTEPKYIGDVSCYASKGSSGKPVGDRQVRERERERARKARGCRRKRREKGKESIRFWASGGPTYIGQSCMEVRVLNRKGCAQSERKTVEARGSN